MSVRIQFHYSTSSHAQLVFSQTFTVGEPMDEDILSDVVPSNIVSRQVSAKLTY